MTDLYPIQTGTPKPKSFLADLPAAFVNSVTLSLTVVVGFSYQNAIKALFEEGGPFFIKSSRVYPWIMPWIVAIIMTIIAVLIGRLAGYKTAPIATTPPLKQTPPPSEKPAEALSTLPFP